MTALLGTLLVGLAVGLLARALKPGEDKLSWIMTALLGVTGAYLAAYLGMAAGWFEQGEAAGWIASVIGAMVLLALFNLAKGKPDL